MLVVGIDMWVVQPVMKGEGEEMGFKYLLPSSPLEKGGRGSGIKQYPPPPSKGGKGMEEPRPPIPLGRVSCVLISSQ